MKQLLLTSLFVGFVGLLTFGLQMIYLTASQPVSRQAVGQQLLSEQRPLEAALMFDDPAWQAVAHFRATRYRQAAGLFQTLDNPQATYNYGVAIARLRRWDDALAAFRVVLDELPDHQDARFNYDLLQRISLQAPQRERRNEGADQGGELREDSQADGEPNAASDQRSQNEAITPEPTGGSDSPGEQGDDAESTQGDSGQDARGKRRQSLANPPTEPVNQSMANLGGEAKTTDTPQPDQQDTIGTRREQSNPNDHIEAMQMRRLNDNAAIVLEARFRAAANSRKESQP